MLNTKQSLLFFLTCFVLVGASSAQNQRVEKNATNCSQAAEMATSSYGALATKFSRSAKDFSFVGAEWKYGQCRVTVDTPKGPIDCLADDIYKSAKGGVFVFLEDGQLKQIACL